MSRPKISAPFNPVHITVRPLDQGPPQDQTQVSQPHRPRRPSASSLSPSTSPYLRPVSPASPRQANPDRSSKGHYRNFSRPVTPQSPTSPSHPPSPSYLRSSSEDPTRPSRKSWFKEENLDSLSPTSGSATAARSFPKPTSPATSDVQRPSSSASNYRSAFTTPQQQSQHDVHELAGFIPPLRNRQDSANSSSSTHLLPPPSPSYYPQSQPHHQRQPSSSSSQHLHSPSTPTSPSFLLSEAEPEIASDIPSLHQHQHQHHSRQNSHSSNGRHSPSTFAAGPPSPRLLPEEHRQQHHQRQRSHSSDTTTPAAGGLIDPAKPGLVSGERKRSMWERVLRRGSEGEDGEVEAFPAAKA